MGYTGSMADHLISTIRYVRHELTAEEIAAIDDVLVKALQRMGREIGEKLEGVSLD